MRSVSAIAIALTLTVTSCGGGDDGDGGLLGETASDDDADTASGAPDIDPCGLLTAEELTAVLGAAPTPEPSEPAGPFTGCSWGTGDVIVSIAPSDTLILAPGQAEECPSADLGDDSRLCPDSVKFLVSGVHVSVSTISPLVEDDQLLTLAATVLPRVSGG